MKHNATGTKPAAGSSLLTHNRRQRGTKPLRNLYRRRLRLEPLEDRRLLANVVVGNNLDVVNGNTVSIPNLIAENGGDGISLREAILAANATAGADVILFAAALSGQTIILGGTELVIPEALTIDAASLAANVTINAGMASRIFNITAETGNFTLSGLTLTGGRITGDSGQGGAIRSLSNVHFVLHQCTVNLNSADGSVTSTMRGGGIFANGNVTITDSTVSGNSADATGAQGAGIWAGGVVTLTGSTVSGNVLTSFSPTTGQGGGIFANGGVTLTDSQVSGNSTTANSDTGGGGIFSYGNVTLTRSTVRGNGVVSQVNTRGGGISAGGDVMLTDSTVDGNRSQSSEFGTVRGGGIFATGNLSITGSTVSGNIAEGFGAAGGGIWSGAVVTIVNSTISGNRVNHSNPPGPVWGAGGIFQHGTGLPFSISGSIVAGNTANSGAPDLVDDPPGTLTINFSLIGMGVVPTAGGNNVVTNDPQLLPLADNGGPTPTHATLATSPAINGGDPSFLGDPTQFDQRGAPFVRVFGGRIDIGAYERQAVASLSLVVDTLADESDGNYAPGDRSLREVISVAQGSIGVETITFAASLTSGGPASLVLTRGELSITDSLTINGPGAHLLTIDASGNDPTPETNIGDGSRVFNIDDGNLTTHKNVSINGLTLTGGDVTGPGGAIFSRENLAIASSVISGNRTAGASSFGGGIYSLRGLTLSHSTVSGNRTWGANSDGGGIYSGGAVMLTQSTVSGNSTVGISERGGGIFSYGAVMLLSQSTVRENSASSAGGGIWAEGVVTLANSTLSGNSAGSAGGGIYSQVDIELTHSDVSGNSATSYGGGMTTFGAVTLTHSTVRENSAGLDGGGIGSHGAVSVTQSTVSGNSASRGGGILSWSGVTLTESTVSGNSASLDGGGIYSHGAVKLTQSTLSGNSASRDGGGISHTNGSLKLEHSTIANNTADANQDSQGRGGGIYAGTNGALELQHTIVGDNRRGAINDDVHSLQVGLADYSLVETNTGASLQSIFGGLIVGLDPLLGPLANNGGPTQTHALLAGSPARNVGNPAAVAGAGTVPLHDQRGAPFNRVMGGRIDIGAFELQPSVPGDFNGDGVVNALDIDLLAIAAAQNPPRNLFYDLNGDGDVTYVVSPPGVIVSDSDVLIRTILQTQYGDLDLNRQVFLSDLIKFATNYRQPGQFGWADGNINGSQEAGTATSPRVSLADLIALATNWRFGAGSASAAALPEPSAGSDMTEASGREQVSEPVTEPTAAPAEVAARMASFTLTETPADRQGSSPRSHRVYSPPQRREFNEDDLQLLALDRVARAARQVVTMPAGHGSNVRHSDNGDPEGLTGEQPAIAAPSRP